MRHAILFTRYNIAPNTPAPVVTLNGESLVSGEMGWGVRGYDGRLLTNAKSESARNKPMWRNSRARARDVLAGEDAVKAAVEKYPHGLEA